ncbi:hypothetical protein [Desulfobacula sp.]|uniref:hypothetical protein n=1 Tax=Desulfobacula sp. TaxID=2593537 RepID=UPI0026022A79|nr:hypothetical protein [Desulfobacula sp.]
MAKPDSKPFLMATNTENLKSILTTSLIRPMEGYRKYYKDFCSFSPGFIPLFIGSIPAKHLSVCQEETDMDVVILSLDLSREKLSALVKDPVEGKDPLEEKNPAGIFFFQGVIPVTAIQHIYFKSKKEKDRFLDFRYAHFHPTDFSLKVNAKAFRQTTIDGDIFHENPGLDAFTSPPPFAEKTVPCTADFLEADARGGVLSLLSASLPPLPEAGKLITAAVHELPSASVDLAVLPEQIKTLHHWIWKQPAATDDVDGILLWHLLNLLSACDPHQGMTASVFLHGLHEEFKRSPDFRQAPKSPYADLIQKLEKRFQEISTSVEGITDPVIFFQDNGIASNVMKGLLLFLLYPKDIYDFPDNKEMMKEWGITPPIHLFATILYAAWQGWTRLDEGICCRDKPHVSAVCNFMADWHNQFYAGHSYGFSPGGTFKVTGQCSPWEKTMLLTLPWKAHHKLGKCALQLAKTRDWPCLHWDITAPKEKLSDLHYTREGGLKLKLIGNVVFKESIDIPLFKTLLEATELTDDEKKHFDMLYTA